MKWILTILIAVKASGCTKWGSGAVASDECIAVGGAAPPVVWLQQLMLKHRMCENDRGDLGSSGGPGHQPAVTMGYQDAQQRFP